ncbi:hypothetical protein ACLBWT_19010 [Paenibacillus sp. D51F]
MARGRWTAARSTRISITEMAEAVNDQGYWCQVAKDVLDEDA